MSKKPATYQVTGFNLLSHAIYSAFLIISSSAKGSIIMRYLYILISVLQFTKDFVEVSSFSLFYIFQTIQNQLPDLFLIFSIIRIVIVRISGYHNIKMEVIICCLYILRVFSKKATATL